MAKVNEVKSKEDKVETKPTAVVETIMEATEPEEKIDEQPKASKATAKAGKRSEKALKEAEEKQAKEERKASATKTDEEPKHRAPVKPVRSRLERRSKKFQAAAKLIEKGKMYSLTEAMELAAKTSPVKFDATVELHIRLNVDPKLADQNIRDTIVLPAGTGKSVRVAVFADLDDVAKAKKAGADVAGADEFLQQLDKNKFDFDVLIATPAMMAKLGKYARVLGPKGLMPNPKSGTVTPDVTKAVSEAKAGRVEYRVDSTGIIHVGIGKVSFGADKLLQNSQAVVTSLRGNKPSSVKGPFIRSAYATTAMGPSIQLSLSEL